MWNKEDRSQTEVNYCLVMITTWGHFDVCILLQSPFPGDRKMLTKCSQRELPPPSKQTCWKHIFNLKCCVDHAALFKYKLFSFFTPKNTKTTKMINPWTIPSIEPLQNTQHIMTLVGWTFYWLMWAKVFRKALDIQSRFWKPYFASVWRGTIASINTAKSSGWPTHNDSRVSIWN